MIFGGGVALVVVERDRLLLGVEDDVAVSAVVVLRALGKCLKKGGIFIPKLSEIPQGERPCAPCDSACGDKRTGETNRVLPASQKSAEPVKAKWAGTSALARFGQPAVMERVTELMFEAPVEDGTRQRGSGQVGRKAGGVLSRPSEWRLGGFRATGRQPKGVSVVPLGQNPHGVESAPTADQGYQTEPKNLAGAFGRVASRRARMIEATDERAGRGRSLRSSPRTGKPSTWRREAVDTASKQGAVL